MHYFMYYQEKRKMKHKLNFIKLVCLLITFSFITGCQVKEKKGDITFIQDKKIEYSHEFKISDLIEKVDDYTRKDFKINEDDTKIDLPNGKTVAINTTDRKIELDTIKFTFRYANKNFIKEVLIQDTTAPKIKCEDTYKVLIHNKYFELEHLIEVEDNYSSKEKVEVYYNGSYDIDKVGAYEVEVIAYDEKKNKSVKKVKIIVEKEKSDEQVTVNGNQSSNDLNTPSSNNAGGNGNGSSNHQPTTPPIEKPVAPPINYYTPQVKEFTIDTYASFDECYAACQNYISKCMQQGYSGVATAEPIKRDGVYIGYRAVFN